MTLRILLIALCSALVAACGGGPGGDVATEGTEPAATIVPTQPAAEASVAPTSAAAGAQSTGAVVPAEVTPSAGGEGGEIIVFAAASLTEAFTEMGERFAEANGGAEVTFNFAGSQQLVAQLAQGAPADVFASASGKQMDAAVESRRIAASAVQSFVRNRLVVIYPKANPARLAKLEDLAREGVKLDLAAKEVPVGQYSLDFLDAAAEDAAYGEAYKRAMLANVVSYEENVKAVVGKVALGEADAGIVYESDVAADDGKLGRITIPDALNQVATYPIAPVADARAPELAGRWVEYVLSAEGQAILREYGFLPVEG